MQQDTFTARVAALTLAIALLGLIAVVAVLAYDGKDVPAVLTGALGLVLGGLLPSPITKAVQPPGDVHVNNVVQDPAATADAVAKRLQTAPTRRGRGQAGEAGCATLVILALAAVGVVALVVWVAS